MTTPTTDPETAGLRCPHCGARNGPAATWCNLCLEPFAAGEPEPVAPPPADPGADGPASELLLPPPTPVGTSDGAGAPSCPPPPPPSPPSPTPSAAVTAGSTDDVAFRTGPDGIEWCCRRCEAFNDVDAVTCGACGERFGALLDDEAVAVPDVGEARLLVSSLLLPGSGLWQLGRQGIGGGIAVLYVMFAGGTLALLSSAGDAGRAVVAVAPLVLGALVLLVGSTLDTLNVSRGSTRVLLDSRALLWCTVVVLGLVTLLFLTTALTATRV